jgi:hypothetical protein
LGDFDEIRAEDAEEICEEGEADMLIFTTPGASPVELTPRRHHRAAVERS